MSPASPDARSTSDLTLASTPAEQSTGCYLLPVPDGWQQGRGAFGGLVLAAMARAIIAKEPEKDRKLRSFSAELAGPVLPGDAIIEVRELRRGSGLSSYTAILQQQGQGLAAASAVLARTRTTGLTEHHLTPPAPPAWSTVEPLPVDPENPIFPVFVRHLEMRPMGPVPFSGQNEPLASGWVRAKHPLVALDAPEIIALVDAFWPSALATEKAPRPVGTVAFTLQYFPPDPPLDPQIPLFYRGRVLAQQDGYMMEARELWSEDGRLIALNQQTIAWIR